MTGPENHTEDIVPAGSDPLVEPMPAEASPNRLQYAALPYRTNEAGEIEVLLITSRTTRRWIIPKGWPMGKLQPRKVAAAEAAEEAGVEGRVSRQPIGRYSYDKVLSSGTTVRCAVDVYALEVQKQRSSWPERKRRERRWMAIAEAAGLVGDAELAPLLRRFSDHEAAERAAIASGTVIGA